MSFNLNKIVDKHLSFTDFSLISEASDIHNLCFDEKESSKHFLNKQVRFNSDVNYSSFLNSSVISDASLLELESEYFKVSENSKAEIKFLNINDNFSGNLDDTLKSRNLYYHINNDNTELTDDLTTVASKSKDNDHNDDTSSWSSGAELSINNIDKCSSNKKESLFKTIDRLSSGFSNESSSPVETVISDELSELDSIPVSINQFGVGNLSKPILNSSNKLKDEIDFLEIDLKYRQTKLTDNAKELAAKKLSEQLNFKEKFNSNNNSCPFVCQTPTELTQPLNIKSNTELFPDLTRLSVHDESILITQQKKLTAVRNRVGVDKIKRKVEDVLPEPDVLEFFDSNKHIFKSVSLSLTSNLSNLKPSLSLANDRLYSIYRNRDLLNQFY